MTPRRRSILEFGAIPGDPSAGIQNRWAIQDCHDALQAKIVPGASAEVWVPQGDFWVRGHNSFDGGVGLAGDGLGLSRLIGVTGHDMIATGVSRLPLGIALDPACLVDLHTAGANGSPVMRGVTSAKGQRRGFRTFGKLHLSQKGGPLDFGRDGDGFGKVSAWCLEFCVDLSRVDPKVRADQAILLGSSDRGTPSPVEVLLARESIVVRCTLGPAGAEEVRSFAFGNLPDPAGVVRVVVQFDHDSRRIVTAIDGVHQAQRGDPYAGFPATPTVRFQANEHCPFGIGSTGPAMNDVSDYAGGPTDLTFFGLAISTAPLYLPDLPGANLVRRDGKPTSDGLSYFFPDMVTLAGYLPLDDVPADVMRWRGMTVYGPGFSGSTLYAMDNAGHQSNYASSGAGAIRGLSIATGPGRYGRAVAAGYTLYARVSRCNLAGGFQGYGSCNFGANYPLSIRGSVLSGSDAPLCLGGTSSASIEDCTFDGTFRTAVRMRFSKANIRNCFAPSWGGHDHIVRSIASTLFMEHCGFDNEGEGGGCAKSPVYAIPGDVFPTTIDFRDVEFGHYAKDVPLVTLDDDGRDLHLRRRFAMFDCSDVLNGSRSHALKVSGAWEVDSDMPDWQPGRFVQPEGVPPVFPSASFHAGAGPV